MNKKVTSLAVANVAGVNGQIIQLQATLTSQGTGVTNKDIQFTVNGTPLPTTVKTDINGIATQSYTISQTPGLYNILAAFTEDDDYLGSTGTGQLTVNKKNSTVVVLNVNGTNGTQVELNATLTDSNGNPFSGQTLYFQVDGTPVGSDDTDSNGVASVPYTINLIGGTHTIQVDFQGNNDYNAATGTGQLKVPLASLYIHTTASNTNPTLGDIITITFKLGNNGPDNATNVTFTLQIPDGMEFVNASTDQGYCTYNDTTRTITWYLGDVKVGDPNLWANVRVVSIGSFILRPFLNTETYDPTLNNDIQTININVKALSEDSQAEVNAQTVGMQTTGLPIGALLMAMLMVLSGIIVPKRKK